MSFADMSTVCVWVLNVRGYFAATQALEKAGEILNGTSFRVGTGTFLSLPKQNISAAEGKKTHTQLTGLTCCC